MNDLSPDAARFWHCFRDATGRDGLPFDVFAFGDDPEMADDLLALVLSGRKQATATRARVYEIEGFGRPPSPGDLSLVLDGQGAPACVIETMQVDLVPFGEVSAEFAFVEGEGDRSLAYWRRVHLEYYTRECAKEGVVFDRSELIVCERFKLLWRPDRSPAKRPP